jgi:hypothetical protein
MRTKEKELDRVLEKFPSWVGVVAIGIAAILVAACIIFFGY